jgi:ribosomal protein S18 acetylase RimI-like enzyme
MASKYSLNQLSIRAADPSDVDWAAELLFSAGPDLFSYVFATKPEQALEIFREAFAAPRHAFSYEFTQILEVDERPVGTILSYTGQTKVDAESLIHGIMAHMLPVTRVPRIIVNLADLSRIKQDVEFDEYYILGLCVDPEFRNNGLGTLLLRDAEVQAIELGCQSICLDVTYANQAAQVLFQRLGYTIVCSKTSHRFEHMTQAGGLHRMRKKLR